MPPALQDVSTAEADMMAKQLQDNPRVQQCIARRTLLGSSHFDVTTPRQKVTRIRQLKSESEQVRRLSSGCVQCAINC